MKKKKISLILLVFGIIMILIGAKKVDANTNKGAWHNFTGMYVTTTEVKTGEKVYVEFYGMKQDMTSVKVHFECGDGQKFVADLINFNSTNQTINKPYFIMPYSAIEGQTYGLSMIEVNCKHGKFSYSTSEGGTNYTNCFGRNYIKVKDMKDNLSLTNLSLASNDTITKGENEKLWLNVEIEGNDNVDFITMSVVNKKEKSISALLSLKSTSEGQYLDLSNIGVQGPLVEGNYYISNVFINPSSENCVWYSLDSQAEDALLLEYNVEFKIENNENEQVDDTNNNDTNLKNIKLLENTGKQNEKIYVDLTVEEFQLNQVMLSFNDKQNNNNFVVYLKDIKSNSPYFIVPYTTEAGEYELNYAILRDLNGNEKHYRRGETISTIEHFDFDSSITILESGLEEIDILNLDNDKITMDIIQKIYNLDSNITIEIDALNNPIISKSLFEAIKGQDKILIIKYNDVEWIFNGNDITDTKSINVSVQITNDIDELTGKVNDGIKIDFAENGKLPGKCLIRVYNANVLNEFFNHEDSNVYYYNDDKGLFNEIALNVKMTEDGYYEFYIKHNSSYIMTKEEINEEYVIGETEDVSVNENDVLQSSVPNKVDIKIVYVIIAIFIVIIVILIVVIIRLTRKKSKIE